MRGRVWKFADNVDTDQIQPAPAMYLAPAEQLQHCMAATRPGWASEVRPGDIIVAGANFGTGSSRPAARVLRDLGVACVLAESINGLFFRNSVNFALAALEVPGIWGAFDEGDEAIVDFSIATVTNPRTGTRLTGRPWPEPLKQVYEAGGLIPLLVSQGLVQT